MIAVQINGKSRELAGPVTVAKLLEDLGVDARIVAVELRGEILTRDQFPDATVQEGDTVEIVRMIGGG